MDLDRIREMIRQQCAKSTQTEFAKRAGVAPAYISDILAGHRRPGPKVCRALGVRLVKGYVRDKAQETTEGMQ